MTLKPEHLNQLTTLQARIAEAESRLKEADARVQTIFREGPFSDMPVAQADCYRLKIELRRLGKAADD